jgi:hypothetical protein
MRLLQLVLVGALALSTTGCGDLLSIEPLATKDNTIFDPALAGVWTDGDEVILTVKEDKPAAYDILWIAAKEGEKVQLKGRLVQLGDHRIFDVTPADPPPFSIPGHAFVALRSVGQGMEIRFIDSSWLRDKVRQSGALAHFTHEGDPAITAPSTEIQAFLLKFGLNEEAFDDPLLLKRLKP